MGRITAFVVALCVWASVAFAQANGKLQIHYLDVGQGDGAVLISPGGEVVLFDDGVLNQCSKPIGYLQSLGITKIDYHIASHYHSDHIGCAAQILGMFPLQKAAYDRGGSYTTNAYSSYAAAVGAKRVTAIKGQTITLDAASAAPVTITFVALNGNGVNTTDENDLSLVAVVRFGEFDAVFGGDLGGSGSGVVDPDPSVCSYSLSPQSVSLSSAGGGFSVGVTTSAGCAWTAVSNTSFCSITSGSSGLGSGTATFSASANGGTDRSGTLTIAGQTVTVSQAGTSTGGGSNTCARPAGAPASATAICNDGTYSSSQNRSGTCSSHGGVKCWLCPGVLCSGLTLGLTSTTPEFLPYTSTSVQWAASYADIESTAAASVGRVEVYKVHHHGSKYSSNTTWLALTTPKVGIVSVGNANPYGHPTFEALSRLHNAGVKTYWTSVGNGAPPTAGQDVVAGNVVVNAAPGATTFTVSYGGTTETFGDWGFTTPGEGLPATPPFGSFDTPTAGSTAMGEVPVTGWALDNSGVVGVDIFRSSVAGELPGLVFIGTATLVTGARPDIAAAYPAYPGNDSAGWGYMLMSNMLPNRGNGTFTLHAYVRTIDGANSLLGSKTMVLNNATSVKPFGTIDTPTQGQTVSGTIVNFGWALTPNPSAIPIDGSTIDIYVDNTLVGHPVYNNVRADIAGLFPGLANSNGAVGYFYLDTTTLTNGVHTMAWVVRDNTGHASGIGSRYFTVANQASAVIDPPATVQSWSALSAWAGYDAAAQPRRDPLDVMVDQWALDEWPRTRTRRTRHATQFAEP